MVALSDARLWNLIRPCNLDFMNMILERAKDVPLIIAFDNPVCKHPTENLTVISRLLRDWTKASRFTVVWGEVFGKELSQSLANRASSLAFPHLKELTLSVGIRFRVANGVFGPSVLLSSAVFSSCAHSVRNICLHLGVFPT